MKRTYRTDRPDQLQRNGNFLGTYVEHGTTPGPTRHLVSEEKIPGKKFFVRNYPRTAFGPTDGEVISGDAVRIGTFDYQGETLELWDYGTPHVVPVVVTNYPAAYLRQLEAKRHAAAQQTALKFWLSKAEGGDGFAQMRLGEIYLHGEGVETNAALARKWLSAALTNGYPQATNLLREIEANTREK